VLQRLLEPLHRTLPHRALRGPLKDVMKETTASGQPPTARAKNRSLISLAPARLAYSTLLF
jgi:hypothetical protein